MSTGKYLTRYVFNFAGGISLPCFYVLFIDKDALYLSVLNTQEEQSESPVARRYFDLKQTDQLLPCADEDKLNTPYRRQETPTKLSYKYGQGDAIELPSVVETHPSDSYNNIPDGETDEDTDPLLQHNRDITTITNGPESLEYKHPIFITENKDDIAKGKFTICFISFFL